MLNFQRCSRELLISLLKAIKKSNRKLLNRLRKKNPSQLLKSRFSNRKNKSRKRRRLLRNKLNQLPWRKRPRRKLSRLLKSRLKMLPRMPLPKMKTKSSITIGEKESKEVNTVVTTAEVEEADADLAKMKTVSSLSRARTKSQEEITAVDVVAEAVADVVEAIVKTNKTDQRVSRSSKMSSRNPRSKSLRRKLLLLRSLQPLR